MNIKERAEKAVEYKHSGCNCCQAVAKACADLVNVSEEDLLKMTSGFAVGMGCMESTCGALIGAVMPPDWKALPLNLKAIPPDLKTPLPNLKAIPPNNSCRLI